jgi:hypothetical protein
MAKPETVTIVVHPSGADADTLTVEDAMQQVLDIFKLLSKAEVERVGHDNVVWRLQSASANSPFTVSAVAVATDPVTIVDQEAHQAKVALGEGWMGLISARAKAAWIDAPAQEILSRILARSLNGIGRTDIRFDDDEIPPIVIDHQAASRADTYLKLIAAEEAAEHEDLTRTEYGGLEGNITDITTYYRKPAFVIRERISGRELKCVLITPAAQAALGGHEWREAWSNRRVFVSGKIYYNESGQVLRIDAEELTEIETTNPELKDIQKGAPAADQPSPRQFIDRLWKEGDA